MPRVSMTIVAIQLTLSGCAGTADVALHSNEAVSLARTAIDNKDSPVCEDESFVRVTEAGDGYDTFWRCSDAGGRALDVIVHVSGNRQVQVFRVGAVEEPTEDVLKIEAKQPSLEDRRTESESGSENISD